MVPGHDLRHLRYEVDWENGHSCDDVDEAKDRRQRAMRVTLPDELCP
jgi:hypothetical protein